VNAATRLRPWNRRGGARVDTFESRANLVRPCRFSVGVHVGVETLNQFASERGSLLIRESKRFDQELLGIDTEMVNALSIARQ
jgi:hypothetical protein